MPFPSLFARFLTCLAVLLLPFSAQSGWNVTVGSASTNGAWSGASPDVWTPSATGATVAASEINSRLDAGTPVEIKAATATGSESGDIVITAAIASANNTAALTLTPGGSGSHRFSGGATVTLNGAAPSLTIAGAVYTVINDVTALQAMSLSGNYALGSDIDASATSGWNSGAGFLPLVDYTDPLNLIGFSGRFDGLGHVVNNILINTTHAYGSGLFGRTAASAVIRNLGLAGGTVTGKNNVGAVVGVNKGSLDAVYSSATVSNVGTSSTGNSNVGGLVGFNDNSGGVARIYNSHNSGAVSAMGPGVGGVAGQSDGEIRYSYNTGTIVGTNYGKIGGLIGINTAGYVYNSYNSGSVTGQGGGPTYYSVTVGGLVGENDGGTLSRTYNTGAVSGYSNVGGLMGAAIGGGSAEYSYNTGAVSASAAVGGLIGYDSGTGINPNPGAMSYWDTQTSGQATSGAGGGGGQGVTTAQMKQQATFSGWDFSRTLSGGLYYNGWHIYEGQSAPLLQQFLTPLTVTANAAGKTYDGVAYSGGNGVGYSATPNGNLLGTVSYGGSWSGATNAGAYTIIPSGQYSNQQGYYITYTNGTLTIAQATLTVTANNASKTYDGTAYSGGNGVAYSGFVNSETSAVLGGTLAYGGSSQGATAAGGYAIVPSGLTASNYAITYANGTLTIATAPAPTPDPYVPPAPTVITTTPGGTTTLTGTTPVTAVPGSTLVIPAGANVAGIAITLTAPSGGGAVAPVTFQIGGLPLTLSGYSPGTVVGFKKVTVNGAETQVLAVTSGSASLSAAAGQPLLALNGSATLTAGADGATVSFSTGSDGSGHIAVTNGSIVLSADAFAAATGIAAIRDGKLYAGEVAAFNPAGKITSGRLGSLDGVSGQLGDSLGPVNAADPTAKVNLTGKSARVSSTVAFADQLAAALGKDVTFQGQNSDGVVRLSNSGVSISGLPLGTLAIDTSRADGVTLRADGLAEVSVSGIVATFAPALPNVSDLLAALPAGGTAQIGAEGVITITYQGIRYWLRPAWSATPGGAAGLSLGQTAVSFGDGKDSYTLLPSFASYAALRKMVSLEAPGATFQANTDGSVSLGVEGKTYVLTPRMKEKLMDEGITSGKRWWQSADGRLYLNAGGAVQEFSVVR